MSQAKVDRYKEEKKHRKAEIQKEKRQKILTRVILCAAAAFIVGWIAFSGYNLYQENKPVTKTEVNLDAINEYMSSLSQIDTETVQ